MSETNGASVLATIRAHRDRLRAGGQRVCDVALERPGWTIEATTQEVADAAHVSAATVVRTAQQLGYRGFPHLRVLLARDLGTVMAPSEAAAGGPATQVQRFFRTLAESATAMASLLSDDDLDRAVNALASAREVLVAGNGVSAPVAQEFGMRLAAIGVRASAPTDNLDQQIRARLLRPDDVCVVISGTGATSASLLVGRAAAAAGATVLTLSSLGGSALADIADIELLTPPPGGGLTEELRSHLRVPQTILVNALVHAVEAADPEAASTAREKVLEVIGDALRDQGA